MGKSTNNKPLTHEEIWDDSALVQSWDEAVEEYKLYHSIHAKGENVEEVLREAEAVGLNEEDLALDEGDVMAEDDAMQAESGQTEDQAAAGFTQEHELHASTNPPVNEAAGATTGPDPTFPAGAIPMPGAVLPHGYYTGLYEGQQQAKQSKS